MVSVIVTFQETKNATQGCGSRKHEHRERPVSDNAFHDAMLAQVSLGPDKSGGLNGWTQHSTRTQFAVKTKAKTAR
jgi:hypothetical protein